MKTYVITGATSGIGNSLVREFSFSNTVFAGYRNDKKLESLVEISKNIIPFYIDMTQPETILSAADFIKSKTGKIDTLINVAGGVVAGAIENIDMNALRTQFEVNTFSHLQFAQNLLSILEGGKIINISSMSSFGIFPFISPYCASKRALDILFNSLAIETKRDIKVVSIKPGVIATPLWGKSVDENSRYINNCTGYEEEMRFLINNAKKNETKGLSVEKVVDVILKADSAKNPKLSYTVGKDAFVAGLISKLPQGVVNRLVKFGLKARVAKQ